MTGAGVVGVNWNRRGPGQPIFFCFVVKDEFVIVLGLLAHVFFGGGEGDSAGEQGAEGFDFHLDASEQAAFEIDGTDDPELGIRFYEGAVLLVDEGVDLYGGGVGAEVDVFDDAYFDAAEIDGSVGL